MSAAPRPRISLIAAVARNGVIGDGNALAWDLPDDRRHFRAVTMGAPVIMGRRTWDSLPPRFRPLPGRRNLVLTRRGPWQAAGAEVADSLDAALERLSGVDRVFVIGGADVYAQALALADELELTEIERDFDGDARFPDWPRAAFDEVRRERHHAPAPNDFDYSFVSYRRRR